MFDCYPQQYNDRRNQLRKDDDTPQEVLVLRGGFSDFQAKFKVARTELFIHHLTY